MCQQPDCNEPIHHWFGLTYSAYLVIPRVALQSMPPEWQRKFVALLDEAEETLDLGDVTPTWPASYAVNIRNPDGKFAVDDARDYDRGRAVVPTKEPPPECGCKKRGSLIIEWDPTCKIHGNPGTACAHCEEPARAEDGGKSVWDEEAGKYLWLCADCAVGF